MAPATHTKVRKADRIRAEVRLATSLGWKNIQEDDHGRLTGLFRNDTGIRFIPPWTRDWVAFGGLMARMDIYPWVDSDLVHIVAAPREYEPVNVNDHPSKEAALMYAGVMAAIVKFSPRS